MKNIFKSLHMPRFVQAQAQAEEPLGELLWVKDAHTIVPWKPKFAKPPMLRIPLIGNDPMAPACPWPRKPPVEIGCVTKTMRKIAEEVSEFSELVPVHGRVNDLVPQNQRTPRTHRSIFPKGGALLAACLAIFFIIHSL